MKHLSLDTAHRIADIQADPLSKVQRLERWAEVLRAHGCAKLTTLTGTEYKLPGERAAMRADNSALALAFQDPVLRSAGLAGDTYGEAKRFFELSDHDLHHIVCDCHCGVEISGSTAARRVRSLVPGTPWLSRLGAVLRSWFG